MSDAASNIRRSSRGVLRDAVLWLLVVLVIVALAAYFVADDYYTHHGAFDCFPDCTTKQDLSNTVSGVALPVAGLFALLAVVRVLWRSLRRG